MKTLLLLSAFIFSIQSFSQHKSTYVGFRFGHLDMASHTPRNYGGLELDFQFENQFGIQYSLLSGKNYFHMPMAPAAGMVLGLVMVNATPLNDSTTNRVGLGVVIGLITALIPESFSYTIPVNQSLSFSPYISPLQLDFIKNEGDKEGEWYAGMGAGVRAHIYMKDQKYRLSPFAEYKIHYANQIPQGYTFGLQISARVSKPKNSASKTKGLGIFNLL